MCVCYPPIFIPCNMQASLIDWYRGEQQAVSCQLHQLAAWQGAMLFGESACCAGHVSPCHTIINLAVVDCYSIIRYSTAARASIQGLRAAVRLCWETSMLHVALEMHSPTLLFLCRYKRCCRHPTVTCFRPAGMIAGNTGVKNKRSARRSCKSILRIPLAALQPAVLRVLSRD